MEKKQRFITNTIYYIFLAGAVYIGICYVLPIIMPFVLAFLIAWLFKGAACLIADKLKCSLKPVHIALIAAFYIILGALLIFLGIKAVYSACCYVVQIPNFYHEQILPFLDKIFQNIKATIAQTQPLLIPNLESSFAQFTSKLGAFISETSINILKGSSDYAKALPGFFIKIIIMVISTFFVAIDYERIKKYLMTIMPKAWQSAVYNVKEQFIETIKIYARSYFLIMLMTFAELCIGLLILRIENAVAIATVIALFDILPVLGTGGILIPWAVIAAISGDYKLSIGLLVINIIIAVVRNIAEPKIVGRQIGLPALITLIAMFVGGRLFGIIGLFGLPIVLSIIVQMKRIKI